MPTRVGKGQGDTDVRHRCPHRGSRPHRAHPGRLPGRAGRGPRSSTGGRGANTSRAAVVNARTLEVLEALDVARRLVKEGIQAPDSPSATVPILIPIDFGGLPTDYPYTLMIPQCTPNACCSIGWSNSAGGAPAKILTTVAQDADGVTAAFADGDTIRARYVVGADGMRSTVREQAGIGFRGGRYEQSFMLADVRLTGDTPADEVMLFWATAGLTVVPRCPTVRTASSRPWRTHPRRRRRSSSKNSSTRAGRRRADGRHGAGVGLRFRIHHRVADTYRAGRILLAGDAAHVHSPAGGQGMNLGIQDAVALATPSPAARRRVRHAARRLQCRAPSDRPAGSGVDRPAHPAGDAAAGRPSATQHGDQRGRSNPCGARRWRGGCRGLVYR